MRTSSLRLAQAGLALFLLMAPVVSAPAIAGQQSSAEQQTVEKIEINAATVEQLQKVPGIGPALAARIVAFREEHGRFERVEDLLNVQGIGVRTLERMRPYLEVESPKLPR